MDEVKITIADADGETVREMDGPGEPGLHRVQWDMRANPARAFSAMVARLWMPYARSTSAKTNERQTTGVRRWRSLPRYFARRL